MSKVQQLLQISIDRNVAVSKCRPKQLKKKSVVQNTIPSQYISILSFLLYINFNFKTVQNHVKTAKYTELHTVVYMPLSDYTDFTASAVITHGGRYRNMYNITIIRY